MKKQFKQTISVILSLCILLSVMTASFVTVSSATSGDWEYTVDEDFQITITKYNGSDSDVEIPSEFRGYPVVKIGYRAFWENRYIINVKVPNTIKCLEEAAFGNCMLLESVELAEGLETIKSYAFQHCSNLKNIVIPSTVNSIWSYIFEDCSSLKSADLSSCKEENLAEGVFKNCTALEDVKLSENITTIRAHAFRGCSSLKTIQLPERLTELYEGAFNGCSSLESIMLPKYLEKVKWWHGNENWTHRYDDAIFDGCDSLKGIDVSSENRFFESIDGVVYNEEVTKIVYVLRNKESIRIPNSFTSIGEKDDTYSNTTLKTFIIPPTVTSIDKIGYYGKHYSYNNKIEGFTIKGVKGSEAERYALNNDFEFVELDPSYFDEEPTEPQETEPTSTVPDESEEPTEPTTATADETEPAETKPEETTAPDTPNEQPTQPPTVEPTNPPVTEPVETPVITGDMSGDGVVDAKDRIILTRYLAKWAGYENQINLEAADINRDGVVDAKDRIYLTRYLAKWKGYETLPTT